LEYAPRYPDHALVLADLDPELYGLQLSIPAGVLGKSEEHAPQTAPRVFAGYVP
jgi:hypothetical protein